MTRADEHELRALVDQAFDLRDGPYLRDAAEWIVRWHERRHLRAYERRQQRHASVLQALRETR